MAPILPSLFALCGLLVATASSLPNGPNPPPTAAQMAHLKTLMPTLPNSALPAPAADAVLKFAAIGVGHQNYTCNGTAFVQTESGDGALADLYDATEFFLSHPSAIHFLPAERHALFLGGGAGSQRLADRDPCLPPLGLHFFDALVRPSFDLRFARPSPLFLLSSKVAAQNSPDADDIAWLFLEDLNDVTPGVGETNGLKSVFRVQTAGGVAPAQCERVGERVDVPYAAEYWFYD